MDSAEGQAPAPLELRSLTITNAISIGIPILAPNGTTQYMNRLARDRTGVALDEVKSKGRFGRTCHPDDLERMLDERRMRLSKGVPFELEWRILPTHREDRWSVR